MNTDHPERSPKVAVDGEREASPDNALEQAIQAFRAGQWKSLSSLDVAACTTSAKRAEYALFAALGYLAAADFSNAERCIRQALEWGCRKELVDRVLLASLNDRMACVAMLDNRKTLAVNHFLVASLAMGLRENIWPETQARKRLRMRETGAELDANDAWRLTGQAVERFRQTLPEEDRPAYTRQAFNAIGYSRYQELASECERGERPPVILLDCKSLPRSGLHYMKNTLAKVLQGQFSFCEWYQEPGCCGKRPCALTAHAEMGQRGGCATLRLVKSHDLRLDDPLYEPLYSLRRVVLIRDPLYVLTSWFTLSQLQQYNDTLLNAGIRMERVWLTHERAVLDAAYRIMDQSYQMPATGLLSQWLEEKSRYAIGFLEKWARPAAGTRQPHTALVVYEGINDFIAGLLEESRAYSPPDTQARMDAFLQDRLAGFQAKTDPYAVASVQLTKYIRENAALFDHAADKIRLRFPDVYSAS